MHLDHIDSEPGRMAGARRPARDRHGIALERYLDEARQRRQEVEKAVAAARRRRAAAALAGLLAAALVWPGRLWRALRATAVRSRGA